MSEQFVQNMLPTTCSNNWLKGLRGRNYIEQCMHGYSKTFDDLNTLEHT